MMLMWMAAVEHLAATRPFTVVEDYIESLPCDGEKKSALWLLAWARQDGLTQRQVVIETLTAGPAPLVLH